MRLRTRILAVALGALMIVPLTVTAAMAEPRNAVYTMSNDPAGNAVLVFARAADGTLSPSGSIATGGLGSGDSLGSQGALVLSDDGRWLLAVNAGSNDVSLLSVSSKGLRLRDVAPSGGARPISVTIHGSLVYVLNDVTDNVSGLLVGRNGTLDPIPGSTRALSGADIAPAQVEFTPYGRHVVVTEKNTNLIDVYDVSKNGRLLGPTVFDSEGETPFGFAFDRSGHLIVSEAFGGAPGLSALSSYAVGRDTLTTISASVPDGQAAACWVVVSSDGRFAYTTNTGSDNVSGYSIGSDGSLTLLSGVPFTAGDGPIDVDVAASFLYVLNAGSHDISAYTVSADGSLTAITGISGLPATAVGLAAQ